MFGNRILKLRAKNKKDVDKTIVINNKTGQKLSIDNFEDVTILLPKKATKKNLAIILKENSGCVFKWISKKLDRFSVDENTYFNTDSSNYISDNSIVVSVYLEGIPTALSHKNVEKETVTKELTLLDGTTKKFSFEKIKGVSVDSKVIDYLLNRGLTDEFTKPKIGFGSAIQTLLTIIMLILLVITTVGVFL